MRHKRAQLAQWCNDTEGIAHSSFEMVSTRLSCATASPLSMGKRVQPLYVAFYARQKETRMRELTSLSELHPLLATTVGIVAGGVTHVLVCCLISFFDTRSSYSILLMLFRF
jgi:hypothetical protein